MAALSSQHRIGRRNSLLDPAGRLATPARLFFLSFLLLAIPVVVGATPPENGAASSALWGTDGERWDPAGRLPDFSYAGYRRGESPIPDRRPTVSVKDFGATGDGTTDDTAAFQMALRKAAGQTIRVPAGTYLITDILEVRAPNSVLQGESSERSRLRFVKPLNEIKPNWGATTTGRPTSNYSWSGGFIAVQGRLNAEPLALVESPARRGNRELTLSDVSALAVGDEIRLTMRDEPQQSLARHLYQGDPGPIENLKDRTRVSFVARVMKIDSRKRRIEFDRPLSTDVRLEWEPAVCRAESSVEEVGIEHLGFDFPNTPYQGHFTELGFNAIALSGVRNCWVRDIHVHNCDSGIFISGVNTTVAHIRFTSERQTERTRRATGHHGITLGGQDNLLSDFEFQTRFMHDITVSRGSSGNVAMRGRGLDLCFDHHRYGPHSNLFTEIDLGEGSRMFQSGGGAALGRHSAAWETFWGIRSRRPQTWPDGWGPDLMNLVGLTATEPSVTDPNGRWFEPIDPDELTPHNLYAAQLQRRLGRTEAE